MMVRDPIRPPRSVSTTLAVTVAVTTKAVRATGLDVPRWRRRKETLPTKQQKRSRQSVLNTTSVRILPFRPDAVASAHAVRWHRRTRTRVESGLARPMIQQRKCEATLGDGVAQVQRTYFRYAQEHRGPNTGDAPLRGVPMGAALIDRAVTWQQHKERGWGECGRRSR